MTAIMRIAAMILAMLMATVPWVTCEETSAVESCRAAGFDPSQLDCKTCGLLPETYQEKCKSCCLSYMTLEKRIKPYQAAVVTHATRISGYFMEISEMLKEDWKGLVEQKGDKRLILRDTSAVPMTPTILWFDELPKNSESMDVYELEALAQDTTVLVGWKRDDVREMLKAILPDA